ncbi:MAG TPA: thioredoxin domain-containing protein [Gammaproteobacteria bacterium]|nr:thioredoxin domain-containing protein [Gammaproteobacteria bacterium]
MPVSKRTTATAALISIASLAIAAAAGIAPIGAAHAQKAAASGGEKPSGVVATVGSEQITQDDLERYAAPELMRLRQERQQVLEQGLDRLLSNRVIAMEAKAKKVSVDDLIASEVTGKVAEPTDAEVDAFYESQKERLDDVPKEQIAPRIKEYLKQQNQQKTFKAYTDSLKAKYGVDVLLQPLRISVDAKGAPSRGPANAPVTLVEFGDFQCPYCAGLEPTLEKIMKTYGDKVRLVFRQFPLESVHPQAWKSAEASLCAREQGKFWELHDAMYGNQKALSVSDLKSSAARLGMDEKRFGECLDAGKYEQEIRGDQRAGEEAGISGTPALFVNGRPVPGGAAEYEVIAKLIDDELARR